ncbi:MAG: hypothetical protein KTR13_08655 [Saprospiraceae bacterium]|nr:hypothetical protein [Saprospiraceae bacterium]
MKQLPVCLFLFLSTFACSQQGLLSETTPRVPESGQRVLFIGQDLQSIGDYVSECKACPTPGGVATYINFDGILRKDFYGALGWTKKKKVFDEDIDWGGGPLNAFKAVNNYPNSDVQIGLYLVDHCREIAEGQLDAELKQLGKFFMAHSETAFYLRIGYEFDGEWNNYYPEDYVAAFKHIVDAFRAAGIENVAYVWQSCTSPIDDIIEGFREDITRYYPGDEYVDWFAYSWFLSPNEGMEGSTQIDLANEVLDLARKHGKPVMVAESSNQGYDNLRLTNRNIAEIIDGPAGKELVNKSPEAIWAEWYDPFFDFIYANEDVIKAVTYINANWDGQDLWNSPYEQGYWGDSRIQVNKYIQERWLEEITKPGWIHGK